MGAAAVVTREPAVCGGGQGPRRQKRGQHHWGLCRDHLSLWHGFGSELFKLYCRAVQHYSITSLPKCWGNYLALWSHLNSWMVMSSITMSSDHTMQCLHCYILLRNTCRFRRVWVILTTKRNNILLVDSYNPCLRTSLMVTCKLPTDNHATLKREVQL